MTLVENTPGSGKPPIVQARNTETESICSCKIAIAIGIIVMLGGLFLTLAYYQILPPGTNSISNLSGSGWLGWGALGLGALILIFGLERLYPSGQSRKNERLKDQFTLEKVLARDPEAGARLKYPILSLPEPHIRRKHIQKMEDLEFYALCQHLFLTKEGKELIEFTKGVAARLKCPLVCAK